MINDQQRSPKFSCMIATPNYFTSIFILPFQSPTFDAGEKSGGFMAEEFRRAARVVDLPFGAFQRSFEVRFFAEAHVFVGQDFTDGDQL